MADLKISTKRLAIDKAHSQMIAFIAIAVFVSVFSLISIYTLLQQRAYQASVESKKQTALTQLQENVEALDQLRASYTEFVSSEENVLGGNPSGQGDRDGDNSRIVLDALSSKYDFPALATSLEKIIGDSDHDLIDITGVDEQAQHGEDEPQTDPSPVDIHFGVNVEVRETEARDFLQLFEKSIRPFQISQLAIGSEDAVSDDRVVFDIVGKTYYQPAKSLGVRMEPVK